MNNNIGINVHKEFLTLLLSGNHALCSQFAQNYVFTKNVPIQSLYENVLKKALYEVGELWETNQISVATEHLASAIVEAILNEFYSSIISEQRVNKKVIVSCVENEYHQIGIKMISDIFEMNGWNTHFLGANTPNNELIYYITIINPDMLALSLSLYYHFPKLEEMIIKIKAVMPGLPILVGGQAFTHGGQEVLAKYDNVIFKPDIYSTEAYIKQINANG
jgi:MerR family transcriptional regulator, light-induced transcriptional regulator